MALPYGPKSEAEAEKIVWGGVKSAKFPDEPVRLMPGMKFKDGVDPATREVMGSSDYPKAMGKVVVGRRY